jgi:hypothetical protein
MATSPRPFAFVLMPFAAGYDDVYHLAIGEACKEAGAYAERVDHQIFTGNILERVFNQIAKADLVIADMSERSPNVFYEVGYAHALGKTTLLLTRDAADIPFDLQQFPHIVYGTSLTKLKSELVRSVRWHLENPSGTATAAPEVLVRANDFELRDAPAVPATRRGAENSIRLNLTFKNASVRAIRRLSFQVGLAVPRVIAGANDESNQPFKGIVDGEQRVFMHAVPIDLMPKQLHELRFRLLPDGASVGRPFPDELPCSVRLYMESGALDYPFTMLLQPSIAASAQA